jgi:hypothetical protein
MRRFVNRSARREAEAGEGLSATSAGVENADCSPATTEGR